MKELDQTPVETAADGGAVNRSSRKRMDLSKILYEPAAPEMASEETFRIHRQTAFAPGCLCPRCGAQVTAPTQAANTTRA